MKIGFLTFYTTEYQKLADMIIPERDKYCQKHGYIHIVKMGPHFDKNMYYAYDRLIYLRDYFIRNDIDIIFVLNPQSVIMNHNRKIEEFIDDTYDFWITKDVHFINAGSMIFRKCDWTINWLNFLISKEPQYRTDCWHEQRCIIHNWDKEEWTHRINLLPQNTINSYNYKLYNPWSEKTSGHFKKGDFILSLPGLNLEQRLNMIPSAEIQNQIIY